MVISNYDNRAFEKDYSNRKDGSDSLVGDLFRKLQTDLGFTDSTHSIEQNGAAAHGLVSGTRPEDLFEPVQLSLSALKERARVRLVVDLQLSILDLSERVEAHCARTICASG